MSITAFITDSSTLITTLAFRCIKIYKIIYLKFPLLAQKHFGNQHSLENQTKFFHSYDSSNYQVNYL